MSTHRCTLRKTANREYLLRRRKTALRITENNLSDIEATEGLPEKKKEKAIAEKQVIIKTLKQRITDEAASSKIIAGRNRIKRIASDGSDEPDHPLKGCEWHVFTVQAVRRNSSDRYTSGKKGKRGKRKKIKKKKTYEKRFLKKVAAHKIQKWVLREQMQKSSRIKYVIKLVEVS